MKTITVIFPLILLSIFAIAQHPFRIKGVETFATAGATVHTFTNNSLIVKGKRNHINAGYSYTFYASAILSTKDKKLDLNIGLGYSGKQVLWKNMAYSVFHSFHFQDGTVL